MVRVDKLDVLMRVNYKITEKNSEKRPKMAVPKSRKSVLLKTMRDMGCDEQRMRIAAQLVEQVVWLEQKLDAAREEVGDQPMVVAYDNGGGQVGTRRNPAYDTMMKLNASYNATIKTLIEACAAPKDEKAARDASNKLSKKTNVMRALRDEQRAVG